MSFELRPGSKHNYNHVILKKNFLKFKAGEVIWVNHGAIDGTGKKAFYCDLICDRSVFKTKNKQHMDYFYRCAIPMVGTTWLYDKTRQRLTIRKFETSNFDFYSHIIVATRYYRDRKEEVVLSEADMLSLINHFWCETIYPRWEPCGQNWILKNEI